MLAAAQHTGLLEVLEKALPLAAAPLTSRLAHQHHSTTRQLLTTLLFMPVVAQFRPWDLRTYTGRQLALLSSREKVYSYRSTERFLSEVAQAGGSETLTDGLAQWTYRLWQHQFQTEMPAEPASTRPGPTFYVDGHHKPVYSSKLIPRGLVGRLGKVLGCRGLVLLHDGQGHPLLALTGRGDQHLTVGLPVVVERFEQANAGQLKIKRVIADREVMGGEFLATALAAQRVVATLLKENQYQGEDSFEKRGEFVPWLYDLKGQLAREVAPATFSLAVTSPLTGQPLKLDVALIRDWRYQKAVPTTEPKLIPIVTTNLTPAPNPFNSEEALELAKAYRARWPLQENIIKDWLLPLGLDVNHGFAGQVVENSEVVKRCEALEQRIATTTKRANSAKQRQAKASQQYQKRQLKLQSQRRKLHGELDLLYEQLYAQAEYRSLNYEQKLEYQEAKNRVEEKLLDLEELKWRAYSASNQEYAKQGEYEGQVKELEKQLAFLKANERPMLELCNAKDQVMTMLKLALANLGMWVRERCFPVEYAHCTWKRLRPFFELGGWVREGEEVVKIELEPFNDRALNRDLRAVCELVSLLELVLPDGRALKLEVSERVKGRSKTAKAKMNQGAIPVYSVSSKVG